jgi:uncharacterized membrane protein YebE (DUF533 family)
MANFLDGVVSGVKELTQGQGADDLAAKAKGAWTSQSTLTKGAIAGGLLGVLLSGGARRLIGSGVKVGGAAVIGGLAYKAYEDWKAGKSADEPDDLVALPQPDDRFSPQDPDAADNLSMRLLQAMVAAAKADGHITPQERARIAEQLPRLGLGAEAQALLAEELDAPLDFARLAGLATTDAEAAEIYAASLLVVDPDAPAEKGYLAMLAARLKLDSGLVAHLHAKAAALA